MNILCHLTPSFTGSAIAIEIVGKAFEISRGRREVSSGSALFESNI